MSVESLLELAKKVLKAKTGSIEQLILYQNFQADVQPIYSIPILEEHIRLQGLVKEAVIVIKRLRENWKDPAYGDYDMTSDFLKKVKDE